MNYKSKCNSSFRISALTLLVTVTMIGCNSSADDQTVPGTGQVRVTRNEFAGLSIESMVAAVRTNGVTISLVPSGNGAQGTKIFINSNQEFPAANTKYQALQNTSGQADSPLGCCSVTIGDGINNAPMTGEVQMVKVPSNWQAEGGTVSLRFALKTADGRAIEGSASGQTIILGN